MYSAKNLCTGGRARKNIDNTEINVVLVINKNKMINNFVILTI